MAERPMSPPSARDEQRLPRRSAENTLSTGPRAGLQRFAEEMDRLFEDFGFGRRLFGAPTLAKSVPDAFAPNIEVFQKDNELIIRADLPGMKREDVNVEITDDALTIHGERRREHEDEREGYYRSERVYGSFSRVIPLPEDTLTEQATASFRDGVLEITMPAPPASKGRRLEIQDAKTK